MHWDSKVSVQLYSQNFQIWNTFCERNTLDTKKNKKNSIGAKCVIWSKSCSSDGSFLSFLPRKHRRSVLSLVDCNLSQHTGEIGFCCGKTLNSFFLLVIVLTHCEVKIHLMKSSDYVGGHREKPVPSLWRRKKNNQDHSHYPEPACEGDATDLTLSIRVLMSLSSLPLWGRK